jgi:hypothetical protein
MGKQQNHDHTSEYTCPECGGHNVVFELTLILNKDMGLFVEQQSFLAQKAPSYYVNQLIREEMKRKTQA